MVSPDFGYNVNMTTVEEIKAAIGKLSPAEHAELDAFLQQADDAWDRQMAADAQAGKLDRLIAQNRLQQAELQLAAETLNRKIMYLRLVRQVGELVDEATRLGTPIPEAQAAAASGS